jgi:hypothetical protein
MIKRLKEAFQNPAIKAWGRNNFGFPDLTDSGAGMSAGELAELTSNTIKTGTAQNAATLGVVPSTVAASAKSDVEYGAVNVKLGSTVSVMDELSPRENGRAGLKMAAQTTIVTAETGGNFGNQPAGDGVEIVSDNAGDVQICTIYGTITGALTTVTSETVTLTGTTFVPTDEVTWENILAIELGSAAVGTITIREASGDATITTISATGTDAGVATLATTDGFGLILRHDASAATTEPVGIVGTGTDGLALTSVDAMNGTTEEDHGTVSFATITKVFTGAVVNTADVTILSSATVDTNVIGVALEAGTAGQTKAASIKPFYH